MKDAISIERVNKLHPKLRAECLALLDKAEALLPANITIRVVQGLRTIEEQDALYAQGRTAPGKIVTKAKGGKSYHNYGLAIDFCLLIDGKVSWVVDANWMKVVKVFKDAGWTWGGDFKSIKDNPHFEKTFGWKVADLLKLYKPGQYVPL